MTCVMTYRFLQVRLTGITNSIVACTPLVDAELFKLSELDITVI